MTAVLCFAAAAAAQTDHDRGSAPSYEFERVPGAARLEGRIRSPCCMKTTGQTLDIHGSPIAIQLRKEIRDRLKRGESPDAIEADFVRRYGKEVLAVPPGNPLASVGTALAVLFGVGGVGAAMMLARWRRRAAEGTAKSSSQLDAADDDGDARDDLDARIDAELDDL